MNYLSPAIIDLQNFTDPRGKLGVVEGAGLPFDIKRVYYLYGVPIGAQRGEHGHKELQQLMICLNGSCEVVLSNGKETFPYVLDNPNKGLYVPKRMWRHLKFNESNTVVVVLASRPYEEEDYLYSFEDFCEFIENTPE